MPGVWPGRRPGKSLLIGAGGHRPRGHWRWWGVLAAFGLPPPSRPRGSRTTPLVKARSNLLVSGFGDPLVGLTLRWRRCKHCLGLAVHSLSTGTGAGGWRRAKISLARVHTGPPRLFCAGVLNPLPGEVPVLYRASRVDRTLVLIDSPPVSHRGVPPDSQKSTLHHVSARPVWFPWCFAWGRGEDQGAVGM